RQISSGASALHVERALLHGKRLLRHCQSREAAASHLESLCGGAVLPALSIPGHLLARDLEVHRLAADRSCHADIVRIVSGTDAHVHDRILLPAADTRVGAWG